VWCTIVFSGQGGCSATVRETVQPHGEAA